jgi:hypothetical protein
MRDVRRVDDCEEAAGLPRLGWRRAEAEEGRMLVARGGIVAGDPVDALGV